MPKRSLLAAIFVSLLAAPPVAAMAARGKTATKAAERTAKYYFKIHDVTADADLVSVGKDLLEQELGSRPEFTSDLSGASTDAAVVAELKKRKLQGFRVSVRVDKLSKEVKPPKPGGRLNQLAVAMKLSVFGTTLPGDKIAFGGEGEASLESEVSDKRMAEEEAAMVKDVMGAALKQAIETAVNKLSQPKSTPVNESKKKKRKK